MLAFAGVDERIDKEKQQGGDGNGRPIIKTPALPEILQGIGVCLRDCGDEAIGFHDPERDKTSALTRRHLRQDHAGGGSRNGLGQRRAGDGLADQIAAVFTGGPDPAIRSQQ